MLVIARVATLEASRAQAVATARSDFERTLAVLREENSTLRRMLEASQRRQDDLLAELVKSLATTAAPARPVSQLVMSPKRTSKDPIEGLGNMLDPVGYDHPMASFTNERAASLMGAEDEDSDGVSRAA